MRLIALGSEQIKLLQAKGLYVDPRTRLYASTLLAPPVRLWACTLSHGTRIDAFSYVSPNASMHSVSIGRYCSVGDGVSILSNHPTNRLTTHPMTYESIFGDPFDVSDHNLLKHEGKLKQTRIGHDVWIGAGTKIMTGVSIGDGCIVGAGSIVTKDVLPFSVVAGVRAKVIRKRFETNLADRIQKIRWWQFNLVEQNLPWEDVPACLDQIEDLVSCQELKPYQPNWISLI